MLIAQSLVHSRAKSEKTAERGYTGGAFSDFYVYALEPLCSVSLVRPRDGFEGGAVVRGMFGHGGTS